MFAIAQKISFQKLKIVAVFTAEGLTYSAALTLINRLKEKNIDSNITVGGVAIHATPDQIPQAQASVYL